MKSKAVEARTIFRPTVTGVTGRQIAFQLALVPLWEELGVPESDSVARSWHQLLDSHQLRVPRGRRVRSC